MSMAFWGRSYTVYHDFVTYAERNALIDVADRMDHRQWTVTGRSGGYEWAPMQLKKQSDIVQRLRAALGHDVSHRAFMVRYPPGSLVKEHQDPVRVDVPVMHIVVREAPHGGIITLNGRPIQLHAGDAVVFFPHTMNHGLSRVCGITSSGAAIFSVGTVM